MKRDSFRTRIGLAVACCSWLALVAVGNYFLHERASEPGTAADAPRTWPAAPFGVAPDKLTLVLAAHPKCPCTRASLRELARLMTDAGGHIVAHVLVRRTSADEGYAGEAEMIASAAAIPGVVVRTDPGGKLSERFGAHTSGQTLLYSAEGKLLFAGGITPERAHQGDSAGRRRILELVRAGSTDRAESAVYGCSLEDEASPGAWARLSKLLLGTDEWASARAK
jgi:hypothetical protein